MSVTRLDALLYRPWPVRIVLQHLFVVIGFDYERLHFAEAFDQHFCGITKIGNETESAFAGVESESNRIDRIMRNGKSLHGDVANRKFRAGAKMRQLRCAPNESQP